MDCEYFEVWAFQGEHRASSFRTPVLSPQFMEAVAQLQKEDPPHLHWSTTAEGKRRASGEGKPLKKLPVIQSQDKSSDSATVKGESPKYKLTKDDLRRLRKFEREKEVGSLSGMQLQSWK